MATVSMTQPAQAEMSWTTTSASVPPQVITPSGRHTSDPIRRRATYNVPYPRLEITLEKRADIANKLPAPMPQSRRQTIRGVRLVFSAPGLFINQADLTQCQLYRPTDVLGPTVNGVTFKDCSFTSCIFGGTAYKHVRFENCSFTRSDFQLAQFIQCQFISCSFSECTAENVTLICTDINPKALITGTPPPIYNYDAPCEDDSKSAMQQDWLEIHRALAAQLLKSNAEIYHTSNSDNALFELKKAELRARKARLKGLSLNRPAAIILEFARCTALSVIMIATRAGTSVLRLLVIAVAAIAIYAVILNHSTIYYQRYPCHVDRFTLASYLMLLDRATSLFLAIGYTNFVSIRAIDNMFLTTGAVIGLIWYALLAAVLIRRVYR